MHELEVNPLPSVAVCLAAFNGVRYLPQQMDSILSQTGILVTVFVSVDRSSDGTENWFQQLSETEHRVALLPFGERFGGAAPNFFRLLREVDFAAFDYVAYADQDDIWLPGKLKCATERMIEVGADGYSSDVVAFWESGRSSYIKKSYPQRQWDYLFESAGPGCTFVLRRNLALELQAALRQNQQGATDVDRHDWFTYAFARARNHPWVIDDYASLMYRQHDENQVGVNAGVSALVLRARQILNGWGLTQALLITRFIGAADIPFVRQWLGGGRLALVNLAFQARNCRRKPTDRLWFAISCLALAVIGWK
jgi:rhamnosyltransferase